MHHHVAFSVQYVALELRASHPKAAALDVLDQAMSGYCAADLPMRQWADDRAMPASPFGQLLLSAFGCSMTPQEWRAYTSAAADPELASTIMDIWPTAVLAGMAERYRDLRADGGFRSHPHVRSAAAHQLPRSGVTRGAGDMNSQATGFKSARSSA